MAKFSKEKIQEALKSTAPLKASSKDGFPALFYQRFWHIVGLEVASFCLDMLNNRKDLRVINGTTILLIPKVQNLGNMRQFRPISLCNVIFQIISKAVANKFRKVFNNCIEETQGALVPGHQITDNILVAYELLHSFKKKMQGVGNFALKLDMSKENNRVEWVFVEKMLQNLGFWPELIELVMNYVKSVSYSVLLNGILRANFNLSRGLKQGDPLSSYLFLICADFSRLLNLAKQERKIEGAKVGRGGMTITHLFFADNSILFGRATNEGARAMKHVIKDYEKMSGQLFNFDKSLIFFSSNVKDGEKRTTGITLGVRIANSLEKYLGWRTMVGRRQKEVFVDLRERFLKRKVRGVFETFQLEVKKYLLSLFYNQFRYTQCSVFYYRLLFPAN